MASLVVEEYNPISVSMEQKHPAKNRLVALAAHWMAVACMLVLVGRRVSATKQHACPAAYSQAVTLELWSRTALGALTQQLVVLTDSAPPDTPEDEAALAHLRTIAMCLMALAMLAQKWMSELRALSGQAGYACKAGGAVQSRAIASLIPARRPGYLDSS